MVNFYRPSWIEIDLAALSYNLNQIMSLFAQGMYVLAVVKADAYGHGLIEVAKHLHSLGVNYLGVASLDEAMLLRKSGIPTPILVLGYVSPDDLQIASSYKISITAVSLKHAKDIALTSIGLNLPLTVHLKVDTGMHRLGVKGEEVLPSAMALKSAPDIRLEGLFTHLPMADVDKNYTLGQIRGFKGMISFLKKNGVEFDLIHLSNSAGLVFRDEFMSFCNMIRPGIVLYGEYPSDDFYKILGLREVMSVKSVVQILRYVKKGEGIGYGHDFIAHKDSLIAVVPVGYGDGYPRLVSGRGQAIVNEHRVNIVGRICMDYLFIDVSSLDGEIREGDEVVLLGRQGVNQIFARDIAGWCGTISYEIMCQMGRRLPRVFKDKSNVVKYLNNNRDVRYKSVDRNLAQRMGVWDVSRSN